MVRRLAITVPVLAVWVNAQESSSSGFLDLPDTLSQELQTVAQDGFMRGFGLASIVCLACGVISLAIHLINRGAGR